LLDAARKLEQKAEEKRRKWMNTTEVKKLVYKVAKGLPNSRTLQDEVSEAIQRYRGPKKRVQAQGLDNSHHRFINACRRNNKVTLGTFHKLTRGAAQLIIETSKDGEDWPVRPVTAKTEDSPDREYVEGTLFFALWRNHVILHQSLACRSNQFEDYLTWLLSRLAADNHIGDSQPPVVLVSLDDPIPPQVRSRAKQPVKKIGIGTPLGTAKVRTKTAGVGFKLSGALWESVQAIWAEVKAPLPEIPLDSELRPYDVRAYLELTCSKKDLDTPAGDVMATLGHSLRHSESDDFRLTLADGSELRGQELKAQKEVRVDCVDKLPVAQPLFREMITYFQELVDNHTIVEDEPFGGSR
jgi:hypothetical protein